MPYVFFSLDCRKIEDFLNESNKFNTITMTILEKKLLKETNDGQVLIPQIVLTFLDTGYTTNCPVSRKVWMNSTDYKETAIKAKLHLYKLMNNVTKFRTGPLTYGRV